MLICSFCSTKERIEEFTTELSDALGKLKFEHVKYAAVHIALLGVELVVEYLLTQALKWLVSFLVLLFDSY